MGLFVVHVNGQKVIVDAPSKTAAGAYGNRIAEVKVEVAGTADLQGADLSAIPVLIKGGVTQAEKDAADAAEKAKADEKAAKKAAAAAPAAAV